MIYDNNNKGVLFRNDRKGSDTHPVHKGTAEIDGVEYWVSCWHNTAKGSGKQYMSLSFTKKESREERNGEIPNGDPIPF